jgi:glycine/D-amino acid oxidase-like deaminating enzyme
MSLHVGIIGAGIIGLSCAYELLQNGYEVTIFDDDDPAQASRAALGLSVIKGNFYARDELFALKSLGHKTFIRWVEGIAQTSGTSNAVLLNSGLTEKFLSQGDFQTQSERAFHGEFTALHQMSSSSAHACWNDCSYARHFPSDAHAHVPSLLNALKKVVLKSGTWERTTVRRFSEHSAVSVQAHDRELRFDRLIVAAGAKTGELLMQSGYASPPFQAVPGHSMSVENENMDDPKLTQVSKFAISTFATDSRIGSRTFDGETINRAEAEEAQRLFAVDESRVQWLYGVRTRQYNRLPYVQGVELDTGSRSRKVLVASGMYRNGFQFASLVSRFALNFVKSAAGNPLTFSAEALRQL